MMYNKARDQRSGGRGTVEARKRRRWRIQPTLLALEGRALLSTFAVTNNAVDDVNTTGTLRWAIAQANAATSPSGIEFELGSTPATITLSQGQLDLSNTSDATTIYDRPGEGAVTVSGNNASRVFQVDSGVTAFISGLTITGGSITGQHGAGVYNDGGNLSLNNVTISGNSDGNTGGGGLGSEGGTTTLANCTVSGNTAVRKGGGVVGYGGTMSLTNCTLSGNSIATPLGYGGGLWDSGVTTVTDCTVSGNSAGETGGGLQVGNGGKMTIGNSIIAGNTAGLSGPDVYHVTGTFISDGNNLIGETNGSSGWVSSDLTGTVASPLNPVLAPLGNYGGPTQTMAELPGSPAIDAGSNALIPSGVTTDQRGTGFPRILNGTVDIGAFESSGFTIAATSGSGQTAEGFVFPNPLVATVTANNTKEPVAGGLVTFTAPASEASAMFIGSPAVIGASGTASVTAENNGFAGSYIVSATANGASGTASFGLRNTPLVSIAVSPGNPELALGVTGQFTATANFSDGSTADFTDLVTWASATPSVATIGATGLASPVAVGQSVITASLAGVTSPDDTLTVIAPIFVVNTTADDFGFYSGTTSLREAIAGANVVPGQTITFDKKVFKTPQTINLALGQLELSDKTGKTTIMGPAAGVTVNAGGASRVFQIDSGVTASISGMTITGGHANYAGGGLANYGGNLTLTDCTVSGNTAGDPRFFPYYGGGGGLCNYGTSDLRNCTISDNTAYGGYGGGVENGGRYSGSVTLSNCTISGNTAGDVGGGLSNRNGSSATLTGCTVSGNTGSFGGGGVLNRGALTITGSAFRANHTYGSGGALSNDSGHIDLLDDGFTGNSAGSAGGAISDNDRGGSGSIAGCTFSGNHAGSTGGGGIDCRAGALTIARSTFAGNTSEGSGGGIIVGYSGTISLTNCTISGNTAGGNGGGLDNYYGTATLTRCTVSGNSAVAGGGIFNQGTLNVSYSTFRSNRAIGGAGGAGIGGGILSNGGSVALGRCSLFSNQAIGGAGANGVAGGAGIGGGLALENNPTATVTSTVFLFNVAQGGAGSAGANGGDGEGGGIAVAIGRTSDTTSVILNADMVALGVAQGGKGGSGANGGNGYGGGIFVGAAGSASLFQSGVVNNLAQGGAGGAGANGGAGSGGGIFVGAAGSASLDQTDLLLNQALGGLGYGGGANGDGIGGGLYVTSGGVVTLRKSTVTENFASFSNGNIYGNVTYE
jgi:CSLREA domain-containing protein